MEDNNYISSSSTSSSDNIAAGRRRSIIDSEHGRYLSWTQRWSYSVGHVFNDLCAAFWFSYLLVFMTDVNGFAGATAGSLMLIGQVADGVVTPFIGYECDKKLDWWICRYGRRKTWHLFGTLCVFVSFPFIFNQCIMCSGSPENYQEFYYSAFIVVFQFGWASVQIAHMALITDLTPISSERVELNAYRYAFTVASNIFVFVTMFVYMEVEKGADQHFGPQDAIMFRNVTFIILGVGSCFAMIFHAGVREKERCLLTGEIKPDRVSFSSDSSTNASGADIVAPSPAVVSINDEPMVRVRWYHWLFEVQFWLVGIIYMGSRLTINITQVYLVKYVSETLKKEKTASAYLPLTVYIVSFASSFLMKKANSKLGKKLTFLIGAVVAIGACVWIYFGDNKAAYVHYEIWPVTILLGVSSTTLLVTSMSITSDLIGENITSGAFVFGTMSLFDKVSNGVAVALLEKFKTCNEQEHDCGNFYRNNMSLVCGAAVLFSLCGLTFQRKIKLTVSRARRSPSPPTVPFEIGEEDIERLLSGAGGVGGTRPKGHKRPKKKKKQKSAQHSTPSESQHYDGGAPGLSSPLLGDYDDSD